MCVHVCVCAWCSRAHLNRSDPLIQIWDTLPCWIHSNSAGWRTHKHKHRLNHMYGLMYDCNTWAHSCTCISPKKHTKEGKNTKRPAYKHQTHKSTHIHKHRHTNMDLTDLRFMIQIITKYQRLFKFPVYLSNITREGALLYWLSAGCDSVEAQGRNFTSFRE